MNTNPIDLQSLSEFFAGIAVDHDCGDIFWTNQVGGTGCFHPIVYGLLVPMPASWAPTCDSLENWALENYDAERVVEWLKNAHLDEIFEPLSAVDIARSPSVVGNSIALAEAWVPVRVREDITTVHDWLYPFRGERMILTYQNSD